MQNNLLTTFNLQYIVDSFGNTSAVLIPLKDWLIIKNKLNIKEDEYVEPTKDEILNGLKEAVKEVKLHLKGKIKLQTAKEFLNEL